MSQVRFSCWLTERERYELERNSTQLGLSLNHVLRLALRAGLGLPVNPELAAAIRVKQEETAS